MRTSTQQKLLDSRSQRPRGDHSILRSLMCPLRGKIVRISTLISQYDLASSHQALTLLSCHELTQIAIRQKLDGGIQYWRRDGTGGFLIPELVQRPPFPPQRTRAVEPRNRVCIWFCFCFAQFRSGLIFFETPLLGYWICGIYCWLQ